MLPIDGLLEGLRESLEQFQCNPSDEAFELVQRHTGTIDALCEDVLVGEDD